MYVRISRSIEHTCGITFWSLFENLFATQFLSFFSIFSLFFFFLFFSPIYITLAAILTPRLYLIIYNNSSDPSFSFTISHRSLSINQRFIFFTPVSYIALFFFFFFYLLCSFKHSETMRKEKERNTFMYRTPSKYYIYRHKLHTYCFFIREKRSHPHLFTFCVFSPVLNCRKLT